MHVSMFRVCYMLLVVLSIHVVTNVNSFSISTISDTSIPKKCDDLLHGIQQLVTFTPLTVDSSDVQTKAIKTLIKLQSLLVGINNNHRDVYINDDRFQVLLKAALSSNVACRADDYRLRVRGMKSLSTIYCNAHDCNRKETNAMIMLSIVALVKSIDKYANSVDIVSLEYAVSKFLQQSDLSSLLLSDTDALKMLGILDAKRDKLCLPFQCIHSLIDEDDGITMQQLLDEIPFKADTITTKGGKQVVERRETSWQVDSHNIGGLSYSGKIIPPVMMTNVVEKIRDAIEAKCGISFDCVLINKYPDGNCACAYHVDPDMGTLYDEKTVIVSFGETRRFCVREIKSDGSRDVDEDDYYSFHLYNNDGFFMYDQCQKKFQHAVLKQENNDNGSCRISMVFKKTLPGVNGSRASGPSLQDIKTSEKMKKRRT